MAGRLQCSICGRDHGHMRLASSGVWVCMKCHGSGSRNRLHVKYSPSSLGLPGGRDADTAAQLAEDKRIAGTDAPDYYTADADPVWEGTAASVRKRSNRYMRKNGFVNRDDYY